MQPSKIIQVKKGMISLPKILRSRWENSRVWVSELGDEKIVLERITPQKKKIDLIAWKRAAGILKDRNIPDPVKWQRKIRKEWERVLS